MKKVIRLGMFETNSSSTHALSIKVKDPNTPWKTVEEIVALDVADEYFIDSDIHREIRSKYAKTIIIYQLFVNYYVEQKYDFIIKMSEIPNVEFIEPDYTSIVYRNKYTKYIKFEMENLTKSGKSLMNKYIRELSKYDNDLKEITKYIWDVVETFDGEDKESMKRMIKSIDDRPGDDSVAIDNFFSNSLLDMYYGDVSFLGFKNKMEKYYINVDFVKKVVEDENIYFESKEGMIAEDDIPRIL